MLTFTSARPPGRIGKAGVSTEYQSAGKSGTSTRTLSTMRPRFVTTSVAVAVRPASIGASGETRAMLRPPAETTSRIRIECDQRRIDRLGRQVARFDFAEPQDSAVFDEVAYARLETFTVDEGPPDAPRSSTRSRPESTVRRAWRREIEKSSMWMLEPSPRPIRADGRSRPCSTSRPWRGYTWRGPNFNGRSLLACG